jgi:hypothetical protein
MLIEAYLQSLEKVSFKAEKRYDHPIDPAPLTELEVPKEENFQSQGNPVSVTGL